MKQTVTVLVTAMLAVLSGAATVLAQGMPDPRLVSGVPLPAADLPVGSVSVRVIRGTFANNLPGVDVEFTIDGQSRTVKTDESGRAQVSNLAAGAHVRAKAVVGSETLQSQEVTIGGSGIRFVLAAAAPDAAPGGAAPAAAAPVKGTVVLGSDSRVVADFAADQLTIYYVIKIVNSAPGPVDLGGPLLFDLPQGARGAAPLEDSTKQATISGEHLTVTGPFAPGTTNVDIAFVLPYSGSVAHVIQKYPAPIQGLQLFVLRSGGDLDLRSPQITAKQNVVEQGQPIVAAAVGSIPAGSALDFEITGLPHHAVWPRNVALGLAAAIALAGFWAAFVSVPAKRAA